MQEDKQLLYVMQNELGLYKIGISADPERRKREISNASGFDVDVLEVFDTGDIPARQREQELHKHFEGTRKRG